MKLTYWCSRQEHDASQFNVRKATRKEVETELDSLADTMGLEYPWGDPFKVEVEYSGGFDLMDQCLGEAGVYEYPEAWTAQSTEADWEIRCQRVKREGMRATVK